MVFKKWENESCTNKFTCSQSYSHGILYIWVTCIVRIKEKDDQKESSTITDQKNETAFNHNISRIFAAVF